MLDAARCGAFRCPFGRPSPQVVRMTKLLADAFKAASLLPKEEQDAIAIAVLAEVGGSDDEWDDRFAQSRSTIERLADEALAAHRRGESKPLDPDEL